MPYFSASTRLASLFGFASAFALGCVISIGPGGDDAGVHECGSLLANNNADCSCLPDHERCNPNDPDDTDCCPREPKPGTCDDPNSSLVGDECFCNIGWAWCSSDPNDLSCCEDPGQTSQGTGTATDSGTGGTTMEVPTTSEGTTGAPQECASKATPPGSCDEAAEAFFCTNPAPACTPYDSQYYVCEGGVYVDQTASMDEQCQLDGYDFSYGCVDENGSVFVECGNGSGDACNGGAASCLDDKVLAQCKWGKQSETDCFVQCTEIGDADMVLYDFGSCGEQDGEIVCRCCDEGDEDCPINEPETTGDGSTGDGSTG
jgi:hypothetical protein